MRSNMSPETRAGNAHAGKHAFPVQVVEGGEMAFLLLSVDEGFLTGGAMESFFDTPIDMVLGSFVFLEATDFVDR